MGAVPAWTLYQISDFKIKFIAFDDHSVFSLMLLVGKIICYHTISGESIKFQVKFPVFPLAPQRNTRTGRVQWSG